MTAKKIKYIFAKPEDILRQLKTVKNMNENLSIMPAIMHGKRVTFIFLEEEMQTKTLTLDGHYPLHEFDDSKIAALEEACRQNGQVVTAQDPD